MKQIGVFLIILISVVAMSVMAQTDNDAEQTKGEETVSAEPTATPENAPTVERQYPIAPGFWYPGDPMPTKPLRYYRVRCWPGCHSYGEFADPENIKKASEKKTGMS